MDLDIRIEECRVNLLVAKQRFEMEVSRFQPEIELIKLKIETWVATHREEGGDTDDTKRQGGFEA